MKTVMMICVLGLFSVGCEFSVDCGSDDVVPPMADAGAGDAGCDFDHLANFYPDDDGDGFGRDTDTPVLSCTYLEGFVVNNLDCNDGSFAIHPEMCDVPDGLDNDCDGTVDNRPDC